ncbi:MAG: T9SS type A sorting domain-containing protein [Bacteroidia bacterium]|jgi:hypothetical protein
MKKCFTFLMLSFGIFVANAQQVIYVDANLGNDTLNGLAATVDAAAGIGPKKTLNAALSICTSGDIVSVESGVYPEDITLNKAVQLVKTGSAAVFIDAITITSIGDVFGNLPLDGAFQTNTVVVQSGAQLNDGYLLTAVNGNLIAQAGSYNELLIAQKSFILTTLGEVSVSSVRMNANGGTLTLGGSLKVNNQVELNQPNGGFFELSAFDLRLDPTASITAGNANSFIKTSGTGTLLRAVGSDAVLFPVGNGTTYAPVTIDENGNATELVGIRVREAMNTNSFNPDLANSVNSFVGLEWTITEGTAGGNNANIRFDYTGNNELNNWASAQNRAVYRNDGTTWTAGANSSVDASFSSADFTALGGVFAIYSDFPNAIETAGSIASLVLYPNPASSNVFIRTDSADDFNYTIFSVEGKVASTGVSKSNSSIDISNLTKGMYVMRVLQGDDVTVLRFVKN